MSDTPRLSLRTRRILSWAPWVGVMLVIALDQGRQREVAIILGLCLAKIGDYVLLPQSEDRRKRRALARMSAMAVLVVTTTSACCCERRCDAERRGPDPVPSDLVEAAPQVLDIDTSAAMLGEVTRLGPEDWAPFVETGTGLAGYRLIRGPTRTITVRLHSTVDQIVSTDYAVAPGGYVVSGDGHIRIRQRPAPGFSPIPPETATPHPASVDEAKDRERRAARPALTVTIDLLESGLALDGEVLGKLVDATPEEQAGTINALRSRLLTRTADPTFRDEATGASLLMVIVRGERKTKWRYVQEIMKVCSDPAIKIYKMHFSLARHEPPKEGAGAGAGK